MGTAHCADWHRMPDISDGLGGTRHDYRRWPLIHDIAKGEYRESCFHSGERDSCKRKLPAVGLARTLYLARPYQARDLESPDNAFPMVCL